MTLLRKEEKSLPTQMDFCNLYMVSHTIPWGNYNFERSTNKIPFFDEFSTSGKICQFNKGLKMQTPKHFSLVVECQT